MWNPTLCKERKGWGTRHLTDVNSAGGSWMSRAPEIATETSALYYPCIEVHDVNWLKATLLAFGQVQRMVPSEFYQSRDTDEVREFCETEGPRGPLLTEARLNSRLVLGKQHNLCEKIKQHKRKLQKQYSQARTEETLGHDSESFLIHQNKMSWELTELLKELGLAWYSRDQRGAGKVWLALHPKLGEAAMSTLALAVAEDSGLDIVTSSQDVHRSMLSSSDEQAFESLAGIEAPSKESVVHELAQVVMKTAFFDFAKLRATDIRDLLNDGKDLRRFKDMLAGIAATIPNIQNPEIREKRLRQASLEVLSEWDKYRGSLPKVAGRYLLESVEQGSKLGEGLKVGALTVLGHAAGLILLLDKVKVAWQKHQKSPFRLLNRVDASLSNEASLYVPPWSKLAKVD